MSQPEIEILLREIIGLDSTSIGAGTVERAIKSRMSACTIESIRTYLDFLRTSTDELQELIESVVVPETWFFRDREAFSAMVRLLSRSWGALPAVSRLRILSVPCCTGEEPYSIAIALTEAGLSNTQMEIDAVDVSRQAIDRAKRGVYGQNSFRGDDLGFRERHLESCGDGHRVPESLRRTINFYQENLFSPSFRVEAAPYDIIFCRNVLIYFERAKQEAVFATLKSLLKPDGFLFVGPAEAVLAGRNGFRAVNEAMSFAFSKEHTPTSTKTRKWGEIPFKADGRNVLPISRKPVVRETTNPPKNPPASIQTDAIGVEKIRQLADSGQFDQAAALCQDYLKQNGQATEVYYLLALIHDAKDEVANAIECYRKVLYLESGHFDALFHMALLYERQGDSTTAKRLRDRAYRSEQTGGSVRQSHSTHSRRNS